MSMSKYEHIRDIEKANTLITVLAKLNLDGEFTKAQFESVKVPGTISFEYAKELRFKQNGDVITPTWYNGQSSQPLLIATRKEFFTKKLPHPIITEKVVTSTGEPIPNIQVKDTFNPSTKLLLNQLFPNWKIEESETDEIEVFRYYYKINPIALDYLAKFAEKGRYETLRYYEDKLRKVGEEYHKLLNIVDCLKR